MSAAAHPLLEELTPLGSRRKLEVVDRSHGVDLARVERAVTDLLAALGQDPRPSGWRTRHGGSRPATPSS